MKGCYCPNCGEKQKYKMEIPSKIEQPCPKCGKPLLAQRDRTGIAVKAFDDTSAHGKSQNNRVG